MRPVVPTLLLLACSQPTSQEVRPAPDEVAHAASATDEAPAARPDGQEEPAADEGAEAPAAVDYTLSARPDGASLFVVVYNDPSGLASRFGHDHAIAPHTFTGSVSWTEGDPAACDIRIEFPVSALRVDPGDLRATAKLDPDGAVSDGNKETITSNFLGKNQLHAAQFSTISYRSTRCTQSGDNVDVTGALTIRGVSKEVTVPMKVSADGTTFKASGRFEASHDDFGFKPFSNLAGALRNQSKLTFVIDVSGTSG